MRKGIINNLYFNIKTCKYIHNILSLISFKDNVGLCESIVQLKVECHKCIDKYVLIVFIYNI